MTEDRVDILDETTREIVGHCYGPTAVGDCPGADADAVVACAGCRIAPTGGGAGYWLLWVPPGSRQCPLAWDLEYVGM
jgi:hypothetical protein